MRVPIPSAGPPNCTVSLQATSATTDSIYVQWHTENCIGSVPIAYGISWYLVGGTLRVPSMPSNLTFINTHEITGLSPNTQYLVILSLVDMCGIGSMTTVLAKTKSLTSELQLITWKWQDFGESTLYTYRFEICFIYLPPVAWQ